MEDGDFARTDSNSIGQWEGEDEREENQPMGSRAGGFGQRTDDIQMQCVFIASYIDTCIHPDAKNTYSNLYSLRYKL